MPIIEHYISMMGNITLGYSIPAITLLDDGIVNANTARRIGVQDYAEWKD